VKENVHNIGATQSTLAGWAFEENSLHLSTLIADNESRQIRVGTSIS